MATFTERTEAPTTDNGYYYANNPFYTAGYGMPNCTCYAWGRFYEINGTRPNLSTGDAENWYGKTDGYSRGTAPKLGAVICWRKGEAGNSSDGSGHVGIVERINEDGTIVTSESGWQDSRFWWTKTRSNDGNWSAGNAYTFQGFIYSPTEFTTESFVKPDWISGNYYLTKAQMQHNARIIFPYLRARGWTKNAIAGLLANMEAESTINPGIWEGLNYGNTSGGYGLTQWTPATKYINFAGDDWETNHYKQLQRIVYESQNGSLQWIKREPYTEWTFAQFVKSTADPYTLACVFAWNYEGSATVLWGTDEAKEALKEYRGGLGNYWYEFVNTLSDKSVPIWLLFRLKQRRK